MNVDGSRMQHITFYSDPTSPTYVHACGVAADNSWNPATSAGTAQLAVYFNGTIKVLTFSHH